MRKQIKILLGAILISLLLLSIAGCVDNNSLMITEVDLIEGGDPIASPVVIEVDNQVVEENRPIITWIDDDGNAGFYTKLKPFVEEYNIPFTSAIITNRGFGGRYMTLEEMQELSDLGCEFVVHTHSHDIDKKLTDMTEEELRYEYSISKKIIGDLGFNDSFVVYPFGAENDLVREIASEYFVAGIDTFNTNIPLGNVVSKPFDPYRIERVNVQVKNIEDIFMRMDEAVKENSWIILVSHVDQGDWYSEDRVRGIIEYALDSGLEFVTLEEGFEQFKHHLN